MKEIPTLPGEPCKVKPHPSWTKQEKWVWQKLCSGEVADFNDAEVANIYGGKLDPKEDEDCPESRILTPTFLQTILLNEPYRGALPPEGIRISGAWFKNYINVSNTTLSHPLMLLNSRFDSDVDLIYLRSSSSLALNASKFSGVLNMASIQIDGGVFMRDGAEFEEVNLVGANIGGLDMDGSTFKSSLNMDSLEVIKSVFMRDGAKFKEVSLRNAEIGKTLEMDGSSFKGTLDMESLQVGGSLFMREKVRVDVKTIDGNKYKVPHTQTFIQKAEFANVVLRGAKIGGQLNMIGSKFCGKLEMDSLQVDGSLFMSEYIVESEEGIIIWRDGAEFAEVDLRGAKVGDSISMAASIFKDKLDMSFLQVGGSVYMREGAKFDKPVFMAFAKVSHNVDLSGSIFPSELDILGKISTTLDLTGTQIKGELRLGSSVHRSTRWNKRAKLTLRNTTIGALQDHENAWPDELELVGFTYSRLGGFGAGERYSMARRDISWIKKWLEKQRSYSPQPYEQLGKVLRETGYKKKANDILYAGKKRERSEATWLNWLNLILQEIFVGYGYRIRYTFGWVIALTLFGAFMLWKTGQGLSNNVPDSIFYSLDMLLPIIKLDEAHYKIPLTSSVAKYYFYFHKLSGYVLASFLIAGLSGITKK